MKPLDIAIQKEGGISKLAVALGITPQTISMWRARKVPKPWAKLIAIKYKRQIKSING